MKRQLLRSEEVVYRSALSILKKDKTKDSLSIKRAIKEVLVKHPNLETQAVVQIWNVLPALIEEELNSPKNR